MENINKLKKITGIEEASIKTNQKEGESGRVDYVLEIVKDKVGLIKDRLGNVVEVITENIGQIAKAAAVSGLIMLNVAGGMVMVGCPTGTGPGTSPIEKPDEPPNEEEEEELTGLDIPLLDINIITATDDFSDRGEEWVLQTFINSSFNSTVAALCNEMTKMKTNINRFKRSDRTQNMPDSEFLTNVGNFLGGMFALGRPRIDTTLTYMAENTDIVPAVNEDLFMAYVQALRGMGYAKTRFHTDSDYETVFNIGLMGGGASVGDLLDDIVAKGGNNYPQSGPYPMEDVRGKAAALLNETYRRLGSGFIANVASSEQLLGLITRAHIRGYQSTQSVNVAFPQITALDDLAAFGIMTVNIDDMQHESAVVNENQIGK